MAQQSLVPRLVVNDAAAAIDFYRVALGAAELDRQVWDGVVVHAAITVAGQEVHLTEAGGQTPSGETEGAPILLSLSVGDADAVGDAMVSAGAAVVYPIEDREYGRREGRLRDPFGHFWIVGHEL